MAEGKSESEVGTSSEGRPSREIGQIARLILAISGGGILGISVVALVGAGFSGQFSQTSSMIFNALLPLFGTWVGTVLAYYFSSKNFESASQSVERMVTLTTEQKLAKVQVQTAMMRPVQITTHKIPAGKEAKHVQLSDLRSKLGDRITRIPIVDENDVVKYIVHQSGLYKFVADRALAGKTADIDKLTLQDLVDDAELKDWVVNIAYAAEDESVASAKKKMEDQKGCQDLIVTKTGSKTEPMLGWITNVDIGKLSKA